MITDVMLRPFLDGGPIRAQSLVFGTITTSWFDTFQGGFEVANAAAQDAPKSAV
jgi:hypothetical protein